MRLFTIGYQGKTFESFIGLLKMNRIDVVVDVRSSARSRKGGFSRKGLEEVLRGNRVGYAHFPQLGVPLQIRRNLLREGDLSGFVEAYEEILEGEEKEIARLLAIVAKRCACLLCYESEYSRCHRWILAERLCRESGGGLEVVHI